MGVLRIFKDWWLEGKMRSELFGLCFSLLGFSSEEAWSFCARSWSYLMRLFCFLCLFGFVSVGIIFNVFIINVMGGLWLLIV